MLILLDRTITEDINNSNIGLKEIAAIDYLLDAAYHGYHIVTGDRSVLEALKKVDGLSPSRSIPILSRLCSKSTQYYNLTNELPRIVRVVGNSKYPHKHNINDRIVYEIPLSRFAEPTSIQQTILLCEDFSDCEFYKLIGELYSFVNKKFSGLNVFCEFVGGGGTNICDHYAIVQNQKDKMCLCICDSDKKSKDSPLGSVANKLNKINDINNLKTELLILPARAIENLIPSKIINELTKQFKDYQKPFDFIVAIEGAYLNDARLYFDMKGGLTLSDMFTKDPNDPLVTMWCHALSKLNGRYEKYAECYTACECIRNCSEETCRIPGFGSKLLDHTVDLCKQISRRDMEHFFSQFVNSCWHEIGSIVFSWCCATAPLRAF